MALAGRSAPRVLIALVGVWALSAAAFAMRTEIDPELVDADFDGLNAVQESLLHTDDKMPDTDGDGFDDVVELARGSDPLDNLSTPPPQTVYVGMTAREHGGVVTLVSALYVSFGQFPFFGFTLGGSIGGVEFTLPPSTLLGTSTIVMYPTKDPSGWIIVIETPIPKAYISAHGYLGIFAKISDSHPETPVVVDVLNLFDFDGQTVQLRTPPIAMYGGSGSIYKPIGRKEDLPTSWATGQVCWQLTQVVGTDGNSLILDVEDANCQPLDSSCDYSACIGGIGVPIRILDAGALAGGG